MPPTRFLLDEVRKAIRLRHYSYRTEKTYVDWIWQFVVFHGKQHPKLLGGADIEKFLSHLAQERNVVAATQSQALAALLFLYKRVLNVDLRARLASKNPYHLIRSATALRPICWKTATTFAVCRN